MVILAAVFVGEENAQVAKSFLLADNERHEQNKEYISKDYMSLFDNINQRLSAITELCYAVTT